jgi:hypothetical protein
MDEATSRDWQSQTIDLTFARGMLFQDPVEDTPRFGVKSLDDQKEFDQVKRRWPCS